VPCLRPANAQAVAAALLAARQQGRRVRTLGAGSRASLRPPLPPGALLLVTTGLSGIVAHEPGDQTITVQAGVSLATLDAALARHGQWLPVCGHAGTGTVGGLLASAADGACDLAFGRTRERVLGGAVALPDGSVAAGRGRVVKNVAGYDLPRLLCGAQDSLGVLVEATFKLEPRPALRAACRAEFATAEHAFAAAHALLDSGLQPAFVDILDAAQLVVGFCGRVHSVQGQLSACHALVARHAPQAVKDLPPEAYDALLARLDDPAGCLTVGETLAGTPRGERDAASGERALLRLGVLPDALQVLWGDALALADLHGVGAALDARPGLGLLFAAVQGEAGAVANAARQLLQRGRRDGGQSRALLVTPGARALLSATDLWGDPPPELFLLERVKAACDPTGVLGAAWPAGSD